MRLLFTSIVVLLFTVTAQAQQNYEVGLRATSINNIGLILKKERSNGDFMRYRLAFGNLNFNFVDNAQFVNLNLGAAIGFERRKVLNERLDFLFGPEPFISLALVAGNGTIATTTSLSAGLGYVVGLNYFLSQRFRVGLEVTPRASFSLNSIGNVTTTQFGVGFSSSSFAVVGVYYFTASKDQDKR